MSLLTSPAAFLLLRTTLLLGLALLAVRLLRGPAVQTLAGRAALAAVALLLLTAPLPRLVPPLWHVPVPAAPRPAAPVVVLTPTALPPLDMSDTGSKKWAGPPPLPLPVPNPPFREDPAKQGGRSLTPTPHPSTVVGAGGLLLLLWATGTALLWLAACQTHLTRLHRRAVPLTDGPAYDMLTALTPNPPRLYACPGIDGSFLAGIVRPTIYLPADHSETFSPDALRAVLAHELAHATRRDTRWTLASRLLCALLWFQPLLWLLCRKLDHVSEDACDLAVLSHACPPRVYADCLLSLAERRSLSRRTSPLTAGLVPFRSQLARRVQHILTVKGNPPMPAVTRRLRFALPAALPAAVLPALSGTLLVAAPVPSSVASWHPVSADPKSPLVGMWLFKGQPLSGGRDALLVYHADGQEEFIAPGTGGHEAEHYYFTYHVNGDQLTEQMKDQGTNDSPTVLHFDISKDMLTIHDAIEDSTGERVDDAAQASLVESMLTATDAHPAAIVMRGRSTLAPLTGATLLAGLTPVQGPGIVVTLNDSKKRPPHMPAGFTPPNIIHDTDIAGVVSQLKASGAEAISINGQRLVATTAIRIVGPTVFINYTPQTPPYVIKAIGNSETLMTQINLPDGVAKRLRAYDPAMLSVQKADTLTLPAYSGALRPQYDTSAALSSLARTDFLAGLTPVQGPGIVVALSDGKLPTPALPAGFAPPSLIHDSDINAVVNELKASGAEAISINGQRLVAISAIRGGGPAILINDTPQAAPFVIQALGNPKTLLAGIELPGGVTKDIRAYDPAMFTTKISPNPLLLPAYTETTTPRYSKSASANAAIPAAAPHQTFTANFRVPRSGTHRIQVFVKDDTGQRSVYDKIGKPGANITVPITAEGEAVTFRFYDNGKLTQTRDEGIKGRSSTIKSEVSSALLAQRSQLALQFNDAKAQSETAKVMLKVMRQQFNKQKADIKPPRPPVTQTLGKSQYNKSIPVGTWIKQQVAAAQNEFRRKSNLPAQNPDRLAAQQRLDDLLKKQAYVFAVHEYAQQWADLYNKEANAEGPLRHSLARDQNKQHHLEMEIRILDAEIEAIERQIAVVKAKNS